MHRRCFQTQKNKTKPVRCLNTFNMYVKSTESNVYYGIGADTYCGCFSLIVNNFEARAYLILFPLYLSFRKSF